MSRTFPCRHESIFDQGGIWSTWSYDHSGERHDWWPLHQSASPRITAQSLFHPSIFVPPSSYYSCPTGLNFREQKETQISLWCKSCSLVLAIVDWFFQIITGDIVNNVGISLEDGYHWSTAVCVVRNLPLTTGYSALIFTQALIKGKWDLRFVWLTQTPTSKCIEPM